MSETALLYAVGAETDDETPTLLMPHEAAYVTETATGLTFAPTTPLEVWGSLTERLIRQEKRIHWAIADAVAFGEHRYGEDSAQWIEETGLAEKTITNIASVGRRVDRSRRRENVSFSHHEIVAKLAPAEQTAYLDLAADKGLSCYDLRQTIKEDQEHQRGRAVDANGEPVCLADAPWTPGREDLTDEARAALDYRAAQMGKRHAIGYEAGWIQALRWLEARDCFREWRDD